MKNESKRQTQLSLRRPPVVLLLLGYRLVGSSVSVVAAVTLLMSSGSVVSAFALFTIDVTKLMNCCTADGAGAGGALWLCPQAANVAARTTPQATTPSRRVRGLLVCDMFSTPLNS